jgi:type VI secretion system protein VasD
MPDLVSFEEMEVRPGEERDLKLSVQPGSRYVGVIAAYRDLPEASWRYVVSLQEGEINQAGVVLGKRGLEPLKQED